MKNPVIKNGDIYSGVKNGTYVINNKIQFKAAWKQVYDLYKTDPNKLKVSNKKLYDLLETQSDNVIENMSRGEGIPGYTWHHNHIPG